MRQLSIKDDRYRDASEIPAAMTACILCSQRDSLLALRFAAVDMGLAGAEIAMLTTLTRLTQLQVRVPDVAVAVTFD